MSAFFISSYIWAPSSDIVSSSIPSWQILTAHAQPFRGARDLAFCLKVPLDSLLLWASSGGSGETARMRRLAWTFAARIGDKYQIRLTRSICYGTGHRPFGKWFKFSKCKTFWSIYDFLTSEEDFKWGSGRVLVEIKAKDSRWNEFVQCDKLIKGNSIVKDKNWILVFKGLSGSPDRQQYWTVPRWVRPENGWVSP